MNKNGSTTTGGQGGSLESIKDSVRGFVDQGQEKVEQLKTRVIDATDKAKARGGEYLDKTTDIIKAHPLKAVGVAFGIGYLGMRLFRR
jgi:ElaB/YqjD/DUF883 family membrane-anchored ribosome-binding protein